MPFEEWKLFGKPANGWLKYLSMAISVILVLALLALSPMVIVLHFVLRALGRFGFYYETEEADHFVIGPESFKKRPV